MTRVSVLGWGTTSALGVGTSTALDALRRGAYGAREPARSPWLARGRSGPGPVHEVPLDARDPGARVRSIASTAIDEALAMAGPRPGAVTGVFAGTTGGFFADAEIRLLEGRRDDPDAWPPFVQRGAGELAAWVAERVGATGPVATYCTACTSSAAALAAAALHLRAGTCARAVVVGYDALGSVMIHGFRGLMLVDPVAARPFDRDRAGLRVGEGCGVLVLGADEDGPFRVEGSCNALAAGHLTSSAVDGSVAEAVMRAALRRSGAEPEEVVSVKAHGTGTRDNDLAEGVGLRRVFGENPPPFASLKGALGHTLGAACALEAALWMGALQAGELPASPGFSSVDPEIGFGPLVAPARPSRGVHVLNAFGFGGSSIAQVIRDA